MLALSCPAAACDGLNKETPPLPPLSDTGADTAFDADSDSVADTAADTVADTAVDAEGTGIGWFWASSAMACVSKKKKCGTP